MPNVWQEIVCLGLRMTGIPWSIREIYARHKVTIINYHDPAPDVFDRHIRLFAKAYSFITIDQLAQGLANKDFAGLPPKPMLVTLDDGHIGNARLFETIKTFPVPAVLYAVAGVVNTNRGFWFHRLFESRQVRERLKSLPDKKSRTVLEKQYGHTDDHVCETPAALSTSQLLEFIAIGGTVGSHTMFHPILPRCDGQVGQFECTESRRVLEALLGRPVMHFALPNGSCDARTRGWLVNAGYATSRSVDPGWVIPESDPLNLPNFSVSDTVGVNKAAIQACGLWSIIKKVCRSGSNHAYNTLPDTTESSR